MLGKLFSTIEKDFQLQTRFWPSQMEILGQNGAMVLIAVGSTPYQGLRTRLCTGIYFDEYNYNDHYSYYDSDNNTRKRKKMVLLVGLAVHNVTELLDSRRAIIGIRKRSTIILSATFTPVAIKWGRCHHQQCLDLHVQ